MRFNIKNTIIDLALIVWLSSGVLVGIAALAVIFNSHENCVEDNRNYLQQRGFYYILTDSTQQFYVLNDHNYLYLYRDTTAYHNYLRKQELIEREKLLYLKHLLLGNNKGGIK